MDAGTKQVGLGCQGVVLRLGSRKDVDAFETDLALRCT